ncbi:MAG: membrane protein insertion efficiency factor YidD [Desulfosarcinaceae bacterium]
MSPRSKSCRYGLATALTNLTTYTAIAALTALLIAWPSAVAVAQSLSQVPGRAETEPETPPLAHQIGFFRQVLSKADGDRCAMYPSCSTYALKSLQKHGALMGWVMASDRLLRCGHDEVRLAPTIRTRSGPKTYDPVANNDFWWSPPDAAPKTGP